MYRSSRVTGIIYTFCICLLLLIATLAGLSIWAYVVGYNTAALVMAIAIPVILLVLLLLITMVGLSIRYREEISAYLQQFFNNTEEKDHLSAK